MGVERCEPIKCASELTKRPVNKGAEKWLGEVIPVLDHGFIYLVDYMGNDQSIEQAARVSYGRGTRKISQTRELIRYLLREEHTGPFEMVEHKYHAKMPLFVARQWVRHRTASLNEMSGRYSILDKEFYIPENDVIGSQSSKNRQGRGKVFDLEQANKVKELLIEDALGNYDHYEYMLNDDGTGKPKDPSRDMLARELARMDLTLNFYTQWYWKIDLHNNFHFLKLRMEPHAQWEIRQYANAMSKIIKDSVPIAWEAFVDYQLEALKITKPETKAIEMLLRDKKISFTEDEVLQVFRKIGIANKREGKEFVEKLDKLGFLESK